MRMKPAISITTTILVCVLATSLASAQTHTAPPPSHNSVNSGTTKKQAASDDSTTNATNPRRVAQPAATASRPAVTHHAVAAVKAPVRTQSSPTGAHLANARGKRHLWRHFVNGAWVEEWVVGPGEGSQPAPEVEASVSGDAAAASAAEASAVEQSVVPDSKYNANGRRDPFVSPVVSHSGGSGCSTGKKCLEIGAINLRGVVHSDNGFIAVVSNSVNKAYFLRENDPVFNGYVVKITGDSIVFQETLQDRLGKSFTREVVKKITAPAV